MSLLLIFLPVLLPVAFIFAFFSPVILVPVILVGSLVFAISSIAGILVQGFDRAYAYRKSLTLSSWRGYRNAILKGNLENLILKGENFTNRNLSGVSFLNTTFFGMNFENSDLKNTNFHDTDLCGANMKDCKVQGTNFTGTIFNKITVLPFSFEEAILEKMSFLKEMKLLVLQENFKPA